MTEAVTAYGHALKAHHSLSAITADGRRIELEFDRWLDRVDAADETVLAQCRPPVLDVGCGPGRFVAELSARGMPALGIDIAGAAVAITRGRGAAAVLRNAFSVLPGEGRWPTILLMDGNIGIGGNPARLVRRMRDTLAPGGRILIETDPDAGRDEVLELRLVRAGTPVGRPFSWAFVGVDALAAHATSAGVRLDDHWQVDGRSFARLSVGHERP